MNRAIKEATVKHFHYEAASVILTRSSTDSSLRTWGLKLRERIGFKRAAVAVARKLAVTMHAMLRTGEFFDRNEGPQHEIVRIAFNIGAPEMSLPRRGPSHSADGVAPLTWQSASSALKAPPAKLHHAAIDVDCEGNPAPGTRVLDAKMLDPSAIRQPHQNPIEINKRVPMFLPAGRIWQSACRAIESRATRPV